MTFTRKTINFYRKRLRKTIERGEISHAHGFVESA
jgi:hypothetical protein